jgi:uncharacterized protein
MVSASKRIDLARLSLSPGQGRRLNLDVHPDDLEYGGQQYATPSAVSAARLDVSRMAGGYALRLRFSTRLSGPCMRCLEDGEMDVAVDAREVDQAGGGEELESPYIEGEELELDGWAHDALALALPLQLLCRPDCAGLCAVCGVSLNDADPAEHRHESGGDPRWDKLRELKLD